MTTGAHSGRPAAFVTGASQGIGAAIAVHLARHGYDVAVSSTRPDKLGSTLSAISAAGARGIPIALDLCEQADIERAAAAALGAFGHIDVLVNNGGVPLRKLALEVTPEEWDSVLAPNLTGTFFLTQQIARHWVERARPGCVVNITSTHGIVGRAERSTYGISKAGLMHMTRMLALEWAPHGIRVNAIAPGRVESGSPARAATAANPDYLKRVLEGIPLRRFCSVEEVAEAVRYLASPEARYITGHTLVMDGGLTAA
ncbi:MAG TPA: glucose 1-dehydrogenase [Burkholderiales bacterium]|nr:glucose 1-dehydrogenase [Burkholderiales bacterium]